MQVAGDPRDFENNTRDHETAIWVAKFLDGLDHGPKFLGVEVTGFRVRLPRWEEDEHLVVINGIEADGTPVVAFVSGEDVLDAINRAGLKRLRGGLRWHVDKFKAGSDT